MIFLSFFVIKYIFFFLNKNCQKMSEKRVTIHWFFFLYFFFESFSFLWQCDEIIRGKAYGNESWRYLIDSNGCGTCNEDWDIEKRWKKIPEQMLGDSKKKNDKSEFAFILAMECEIRNGNNFSLSLNVSSESIEHFCECPLFRFN